MSSKYIYAGTRATVLKNTLLNQDQLEVLLSGQDYNESYRYLHETFLAPYIARRSGQDLPAALEDVITDTKLLLQSIAPEPELLDILWLKYDFYNLTAVIKGDRLSLAKEQIEAKCFQTGKFEPGVLIDKFSADQLNHLDPYLHQAGLEARNVQDVSDISSTTNRFYFAAINELANRSREPFVRQYVRLLIDIYNLQANLRALSYGELDQAPYPVYIPGGLFRRQDLNSTEDILNNLHRLNGQPEYWQTAIDEYRTGGSYVELERASDNLISQFLYQASMNIFSPAPLFAYFQAKKNNVQLIRTIMVGKQTGLSEHEIKQILRSRYA